MATLKGTDGSLQQTEPNLASRVSLHAPYVDDTDGGRFQVSLKTGLITTIAAMTITAGHLFGFRNPSASKTILIDRLKIKACMVTDFTTLQQLHFAARKATGFSVLHSAGGAAVTLTGEGPKKRTTQLASIATAYLATTAAITGQTAVDISGKTPLVMAISGQPSAGATTAKIPFGEEFIGVRDGGPITLTENEGLIVSNEILMGAAGTCILGIDISWREMANAAALRL